LEHRTNELRRQAFCIIRLPTVRGKFITIVFIQPIICSYPKEPTVVLKNAIHLAMRKPIFDGEMLEFQVLVLGEKRQGEREETAPEQDKNFCPAMNEF
jgi:hypothetical protein